MFALCNRAIKLFKRTRAPASKSSIKGAHALEQGVVHVLLKDQAHSPDMANLLQKIKNYKPKQSYLEFKNETGEIEMASSALKFLNSARKQSERFKSRQETKIRNLASQTYQGAESDDDAEFKGVVREEDDDELDLDDDDVEVDEKPVVKATKKSTSNLQKRYCFS